MRRRRKPRPLWLRVLIGESMRQSLIAWAKQSPAGRRAFIRDFASMTTAQRRAWARSVVSIDPRRGVNSAKEAAT